MLRNCLVQPFNPIAFRTAKTLWSFGCSECNRVKDNLQAEYCINSPAIRHGHCHQLQWNFNGSNTDGSFTTAVSNSFLSPYEKFHSCRFGIILGDFLIENGILCSH